MHSPFLITSSPSPSFPSFSYPYFVHPLLGPTMCSGERLNSSSGASRPTAVLDHIKKIKTNCTKSWAFPLNVNLSRVNSCMLCLFRFNFYDAVGRPYTQLPPKAILIHSGGIKLLWEINKSIDWLMIDWLNHYAMCSAQRHPYADRVSTTVLLISGSVFKSRSSVTEMTTAATGATRPKHSAVSDLPGRVAVIMPPPRRGGGIKRSSASVVRPSVWCELNWTLLENSSHEAKEKWKQDTIIK